MTALVISFKECTVKQQAKCKVQASCKAQLKSNTQLIQVAVKLYGKCMMLFKVHHAMNMSNNDMEMSSSHLNWPYCQFSN